MPTRSSLLVFGTNLCTSTTEYCFNSSTGTAGRQKQKRKREEVHRRQRKEEELDRELARIAAVEATL